MRVFVGMARDSVDISRWLTVSRGGNSLQLILVGDENTTRATMPQSRRC